MRSIIASALIAASASVSAQYVTGNNLLTRMDSNSHGDRMYAIGYVVGVIDSMNGYVFCLPRGFVVGQAHDMVHNYLTNVPADRHLAADVIAAKVLTASFPCAKGNI
jgi:MFS-type transporter involved in bile tolerance (Atg22 family)